MNEHTDFQAFWRALDAAQADNEKLQAMVTWLQAFFPELDLRWRAAEDAQAASGAVMLGRIEVAAREGAMGGVGRLYRYLSVLLGMLLENMAQDQAFVDIHDLQASPPNAATNALPELVSHTTKIRINPLDPAAEVADFMSQIGIWRYAPADQGWYFSAQALEMLEVAPQSAQTDAEGMIRVDEDVLLQTVEAKSSRGIFAELLQQIRTAQAIVTTETHWCRNRAESASTMSSGSVQRPFCDKHLIWVGIPAFDAGGTLLAVHGAVHDTTRWEEIKHRMYYHVALEARINRIAGRFIYMPGKEIPGAIFEALAQVAESTFVDRAYLYVYEDLEQCFLLQDEWHQDALPAMQFGGKHVTPALGSWSFNLLTEGENVLVREVDALPPEAAHEAMQLRERGSRAALLLPVHIDERLAGYVGFETMAAPTHWSEDVLDILRSFSETLFNALERLRGAEMRGAHLRYLEKMDQVNQVLLGTNNLEVMLPRLMKRVLNLFHCDRAFVQYPCDPEASRYEVRAEHTNPDYPGALAHGGFLPAHPDVQEIMRKVLASSQPLAFDPSTGLALTANQQEWGVQSAVIFAVRPRIGAPWLFGMHQCTHPRQWLHEELRLFHDIGMRLTDALNLLLLHTDMQRSEAHFRSLLEGNPDLIFIFDREGRCHDVMPREHPLLMEPVEEVLRYTISERLPAKTAATTLAFIGKVLDEGGVQSFEFQALRAKTETWVSARCVRFEGGRNPKVLMSFRDITDVKLAEMERQHMEAQIQHAQKLESLGVLAGGIAHDFNNLLMGILGNADMALTEMPQGSGVRAYLDDIITSSQRAADLCRQMLAYSGKGRFVIQDLNLSALVEEMAHLLEISISKKALLRYDFAKGLPYVQGDATQIRQVVMNLITNASDAIGDRSGIITLVTGAMECDMQYLRSTFLDDQLNPGIYVYIEVSDTGSGMDEETQTRLFEPFYTTKFTGRGLGMSAVLGIVRGHNGAIKCYSEPGRGTTFKVLFPISEQEMAPSEPTEKQAATQSGAGTILVVDDEETIRAIARKVLERAGYTVLTATDGREALEVYQEAQQQGAIARQAGLQPPNPIGLVLLDMTMPHMSGPETYAQLREMHATIPVILSSGYSPEEITSQFEGLAGFIQKPYLGSELLEIVAKAFEEYSS